MAKAQKKTSNCTQVHPGNPAHDSKRQDCDFLSDAPRWCMIRKLVHESKR